MELKKLPRTELQIMKFIWSSSDEVSAKDIAKFMSENCSWTFGSTSKTILRLVDKGFIEAKKIGRLNFYSPLVKEEEYLEFETDDFFKFLHGKSLTGLISTLQKTKNISDEDIKELKEWIEKK